MRQIIVGEHPEDKLGQLIKVGDIIAYGHALGRCAALRIGKVLDLKIRNEKTYFIDRHDRYWRDTIWDDGVGRAAKMIPNPEPKAGEVTEREWSITVIGIDNDSNRSLWTVTRTPRLNSTKGTLMYPERTLVLLDAQIPQDVKDLLGPIDIKTNIKKYSESLKVKP